MIFAALALLFAQDVPAPAQDAAEGEEIVVRATFGHTTMLFDKGADGKLRNCRVMVSSGSQRRDTAACQQTPVCYAKTADEVTDCVDLTVLEMAEAVGSPDLSKPVANGTGGGVQTFTLPKLTQPKPALLAGQAGPLENTEETKETERQRVKLPPLPKPPSDGPVIRFGGPDDAQRP